MFLNRINKRVQQEKSAWRFARQAGASRDGSYALHSSGTKKPLPGLLLYAITLARRLNRQLLATSSVQQTITAT